MPLAQCESVLLLSVDDLHGNAWQNCIHVSLPSRNTSGNPGGFCSERPKEPSRQRCPSQLDYSEKEKQILFHQWQIFEFVLCMNRNVHRRRGGGNRTIFARDTRVAPQRRALLDGVSTSLPSVALFGNVERHFK